MYWIGVLKVDLAHLRTKKRNQPRHRRPVFTDQGLQRIAPLTVVLFLLVNSISPYVSANETNKTSQAISSEISQARRSLLSVPDPDLSRFETAVQGGLRAMQMRLAALVGAPEVTDRELANAYGELGQHYQAHHIYVPAESCYINAQTLAPEEFRWFYLAGYLAQQNGQLEKTVDHYRHALELRPEYEPARLRLAEAYIDLNQTEPAAGLLNDPFRTQGIHGAVLFAQGKIALSKRDFETAAHLLELSLSKQPHATRIHYPLAMAYRALGDVERAKQHIQQYGDGLPKIPDPLLTELGELVRGGRPQLHRGLTAVQTGQYDTAIEAFSLAMAGNPDNVYLRLSLARTLYLAGKREPAKRQFEDILKRQPGHALTNFFLGVLLEEEGSHAAAIERYEATLITEPHHGGAHHYLGNARMLEGRYSEAAQHYAHAVRRFPQSATVRFLEAMALLRAGAPHTIVRDRLELAIAEFPDKPIFRFALARMLATSTDDRVRDGTQALTSAQALFDQYRSAENAETVAMAYAQLGRFDDAIVQQTNAMDLAFMGGRFDLVPRLENCLNRYRNRQPCQTPWTESDPIFKPKPVDTTRVFRYYPTPSPY